MTETDWLAAMERPICPGHPITLGLLIMRLYPNLETACRIDEGTAPAVLFDKSIPGGYDAILKALDLLKSIRLRDSLDWAIERSCHDFEMTHKAQNPVQYEASQEQAQRLRSEFLTVAANWFQVNVTLSIEHIRCIQASFNELDSVGMYRGLVHADQFKDVCDLLKFERPHGLREIASEAAD